MSENDMNCGTCIFWNLIGESEEHECSVGFCSRFPPQLCETLLRAKARDEFATKDTSQLAELHSDIGLWKQPVTGDFYWCGEWKRKQSVPLIDEN